MFGFWTPSILLRANEVIEWRRTGCDGGERCGKVGTMIPAGTVDGASRGTNIALQHHATAFVSVGSIATG